MLVMINQGKHSGDFTLCHTCSLHNTTSIWASRSLCPWQTWQPLRWRIACV